MIKQILFVLLIAGAVFCQEEGAKNADNDQNLPDRSNEKRTNRGNGLNEFGTQLIDVALIAEKNAKRAYEDAKPTLGAIKKGILGGLKKIKNDPRVQKYTEEIASHPTTQQLKRGLEIWGNEIKTNPQRILEQGRQTINKLVETVDSRRRNLEEKLRYEHEQRQEALKKSQQNPSNED